MDAQAPASPLGAQCQLHVGQPFSAVCQRCGTYMCSVCSEGGRHALCGACRERAGLGEFPFRRDAYTLNALFDYAWNAYKQHWAILAAGVVITFGVVFAVSMLGVLVSLLLQDNLYLMAALRLILLIPQLVLQGTMTLGMLAMSLKVARGQTPELGDLFSAWRKLGPWLAQSAVIALLFTPLAFLFGIFAVVSASMNASPLIVGIIAISVGALVMPVVLYVMMGFAFANLELVAQTGVGAVDGLKNSWAIARGKRLELMLVGIAIFALYFVGALACLIGALFTMSYASVVYGSYYLAVRNGAPGLVDRG
jgi:hypothetical protein